MNIYEEIAILKRHVLSLEQRVLSLEQRERKMELENPHHERTRPWNLNGDMIATRSSIRGVIPPHDPRLDELIIERGYEDPQKQKHQRIVRNALTFFATSKLGATMEIDMRGSTDHEIANVLEKITASGMRNFYIHFLARDAEWFMKRLALHVTKGDPQLPHKVATTHPDADPNWTIVIRTGSTTGVNRYRTPLSIKLIVLV